MATWNEVTKFYQDLQGKKIETEMSNARVNNRIITPELHSMIIHKCTLDALNEIRGQYLTNYSDYVDRNVIIYYSGFLSIKNGNLGISVEDNDINGFMASVHGLNKKKGLDLFLHTPGGSISAAEEIVEYLRSLFDGNIRVVIPQIAMSAGTMIACSGKEIIMGKQSSLGPTDPQINGVPTHGILEEFETAMNEVLKDKNRILLWREIISKYHPTFLGECKKAIELSSELVENWLESGMFSDDENAKKIAENITEHLNNHGASKTHDRHFSTKTCKEFGLKIKEMESDQDLQDKILSIHHATMLTINILQTSKIIQSQQNEPWIVTFAVSNK